MNAQQNIHIGYHVRKKMDELKMTPTVFARRLGCERSYVYDIFKREHINIELLAKISEALDYDFIHKIYLTDYRFNSNSNNRSRIFVEIDMDEEELEKLSIFEGLKSVIQYVRIKKQ